MEHFYLDLLSLFFTILIVLVVSLLLFKIATAPKITTRADGTTSILYSSIPSSLQFYLRLLTSRYNLSKPSKLSPSKPIPPYEVIVEDGRLDDSKLQKFLLVCKLSAPRYKKEQPITWNFAGILPLAACIVTHPKFPLRPISTLIHMKQTISQIRPLEIGEKTKKRLLMGGGKVTERGSELEGLVEVYNQDASILIANGKSSFLIPGKRGAKKEESDSTPQIPITRTTTFAVSGSTGKLYASASGDYNPWHLTPLLAKIFGYKKPISQGYWSVNRCISELGENLPEYPLHFEVEWQKPLFMPSTVKFTERRQADGKKIVFELATEDGQHVHLVGSIENVPNLQLTKATKLD